MRPLIQKMSKDSYFRQMILQSVEQVIRSLIPLYVMGPQKCIWYKPWCIIEDFGVWFHIVDPTLKFSESQNINFKVFLFIFL